MNIMVQFVEMAVSIAAIMAVGRVFFSIPDIYSFTDLRNRFLAMIH